MLRDNLNIIMLFKTDNTNLRHVYDDHVGSDMTYDNFKTLCNICWKEKYDYLTINKEEENVYSGKYTRNFKEILEIQIT